MQTHGLSGISVIVTRSAQQADSFLDQLRSQGCEPISVPALEILPPSSWSELDNQFDHLEDFSWLILTSSNAVDFLIERLKYKGHDIESLSGIKIAVDIQPSEYTLSGLADALLNWNNADIQKTK